MSTGIKRALVTGAGGFIGHHLVAHLRRNGYWVRGVDLHLPEFRPTEADEFLLLDLREKRNAERATSDIDEVYALAADMGGMGFISANHATIMYNNSLIDFNTLEAARRNGASRFFYASSACVYPSHLQSSADVTGLREEVSHPADPEDGYGWEKLHIEHACAYYREEFGLETRVARLHNVYGPYSTYAGGREKAPAALARKAALAAPGGEMEIWGDGRQTRSFCYVDDCVEGIRRLTASDFPGPVNIGTEHLIAIDDLARMLLSIAGKEDVRLVHRPGPQGVRGRNSDNTLLREKLRWEPATPLWEGMSAMYHWIERDIARRGRDVAVSSIVPRAEEPHVRP
ncbi:NAD-dependent epimerase/dehydratase family protein [Marinactinospora thermotolerans]|uniref:Nucleoside-diphosphate-sugar epimerase n=2 Tax=Marinactinospora thermotolerans TaxID=531310 RepID=A0A1T4T419_9ACTN|nr:NAD-dependent epimerase/dehydratase family protein [Marinactinospora thermotolerans]AET51872.1 NAD-dependent epimerase/dehydratase [Marinactinospora thermotolerans]SKA35222.1 Nucleoside-diphosphate-sugar epimerase [Marinactinospora thermotolerans DSM 45154]